MSAILSVLFLAVSAGAMDISGSGGSASAASIGAGALPTNVIASSVAVGAVGLSQMSSAAYGTTGVSKLLQLDDVGDIAESVNIRGPKIVVNNPTDANNYSLAVTTGHVTVNGPYQGTHRLTVIDNRGSNPTMAIRNSLSSGTTSIAIQNHSSQTVLEVGYYGAGLDPGQGGGYAFVAAQIATATVLGYLGNPNLVTISSFNYVSIGALDPVPPYPLTVTGQAAFSGAIKIGVKTAAQLQALVPGRIGEQWQNSNDSYMIYIATGTSAGQFAACYSKTQGP